MAAPLLPEDGVTAAHWIVGSIGGAIGAIITAAGFIWRAASVASAARAALEQHRKDIDVLEKEVKDLVQKGDTRHEENQRAIHELSRTVAAQPDKGDFRRLEDKVERTLDEIKRIVIQAPRP
jgi:polyhydroxyalkanoate synthesis regulator phasin